jgi:penicillin-binding protein 1A
MDRATTIKRVILGCGAVLLVLGAALFAWVWFAPCWAGGCAPLDDLAEYQAEGSQLLDIDGKPFGTLATVNRRVVALDSLPAYLPEAFVAVEDRRFYSHSGLDVRRIFGALIRNVKAGGIEEGGSTITMQLARNLFPEWLPYQDRSLKRKLMEARVARQIERTFSKQKILELYLNHIYLGSGAYGVEAAAQEYFGKPAAKLDLAQSATLAALPKAPSDLDPKENPKGAHERRDLVLDRMVQAGYISSAEASDAKQEPLRVVEESEDPKAAPAAYFVERVRREMGDLLGNSFYTAGLKIYTTLDSRAQKVAEEELARELDAIESGAFGTFRHPTYPESKGKSEGTGQTPYLQGAVVLMDAATGEVRALVGGRDHQDSKFDRATQAVRQPGSAFKPFVYLTALENGHSPIDVVEDAPLKITLTGGKVWEPRNYTDSYQGTMTLRDALTRSKNTATVRLAQEVGIPAIISRAHDLGITTPIPDVPSAALGVAGVRPLELVDAYAAFANGGDRVEPHFIRKVVDRHGQVVWEGSAQSAGVIDPAAAFVLTTMLEDVVNRGTGTAVRAVGFRGPAAGKTGTTNDATNVWFVGYTPELVGGVWMGFDTPTEIVRGASGGTLAAPVWGRIMKRVYEGRPMPAGWQVPPGVDTAQVEVGTGRIVGITCPPTGPTYTEYFMGGIPAESCAAMTQYATVLPGDTAWHDEEWGAIADDTLANAPLPSGVDWPELEALRRRIRVGEAQAGGAPMDTSFALPPLGPPVTQPGATPRRSLPPRPLPPPPPPESGDSLPRADQPDAGPRLLGRPVVRDSTAPSPPDSTPAATAPF